jgi:hypothetical protein
MWPRFDQVLTRDHGSVDCRAITQGLSDAHPRIKDLEQAGISMTAVTTIFIHEGVDKFCKALHALLDTIKQRQGHYLCINQRTGRRIPTPLTPCGSRAPPCLAPHPTAAVRASLARG